MLIVDDLINENIELKPLPKVKEGFIHEDYKTGTKFIYARGGIHEDMKRTKTNEPMALHNGRRSQRLTDS